ncbi:Ig kappa chain V-II region TEW, partial [Sciurus carolinensis]|nr:Ig kappa chain V-II region TEW [Sciurus carolinensis]
VKTSTLLSLSLTHEQPASMSCRFTQSLLHGDRNTFMSWYLQRPGQSPSLLMYKISKGSSGVPDMFSGSVSGTDFTLNISRVEVKDAGVYYSFVATTVPPTVVQA